MARSLSRSLLNFARCPHQEFLCDAWSAYNGEEDGAVRLSLLKTLAN